MGDSERLSLEATGAEDVMIKRVYASELNIGRDVKSWHVEALGLGIEVFGPWDGSGISWRASDPKALRFAVVPWWQQTVTSRVQRPFSVDLHISGYKSFR